jgi:hypothetical protein
VSLANDGPGKATILRNAAAADRLHTELIRALTLITSVPGNLEVEIAPIVESVLRRVDWQRQLQGDIEFTRREIQQVMTCVDAWAARMRPSLQADIADGGDDAKLSADMRELASRLRQVGETAALGEPNVQAAPSAVKGFHSAAASVDSAASSLIAGHGNETELVAAVTEASDAMSPSSSATDTEDSRAAL